MRGLCFFVLLGLGSSTFSQQQAAPDSGAVLSFRLERGAVTLPSFTLTIHPSGAAHYEVSQPSESPRPNPYSVPLAPAAPTLETVDVMLTPTHAAELFHLSQTASRCESKAKHIANMGVKTVTYTTANGAPTTCTFNHTDDKNLQTLTDTVQGIATAIDAGRAITKELKYDHLALDREMEQLVQEVKDGRAADLEVIVPTLHAVADDPEVLERVRASAAKLLAQAGS